MICVDFFIAKIFCVVDSNHKLKIACHCYNSLWLNINALENLAEIKRKANEGTFLILVIRIVLPPWRSCSVGTQSRVLNALQKY